MNPHKVRWPRSVLAAALLAGGCAKILGFNEPTEVACVTTADCATGFECVDFTCQCVENCGSGGNAGTGAGATAGTDSFAAAGMGAGRGGAGGTDAAGGDGGGGDDGGGGGDGGSGATGVGGVGGVAGSGKGGAGGSTGGSSGDGGAGAGGEFEECDPEDTTSCFLCDETGHYMPGSPCEAACDEDRVCRTPRSCDGLTTTCAGQNCCLSLPVPGDEFLRSCDEDCYANCPNASNGFPARVSPLSLDAFEVTVGRFRRFVVAYPGSIPDPGAGANQRNEDDLGWQDEWKSLLPSTREALEAQLTSVADCGLEATWTTSGSTNESRPINCVSWYLAQAFCVWDGGRLPTEAEWNLVAAGGSEARVYPWSKPPSDATIDETYAVYKWPTDAPSGPENVGTREAGRGRWGHYDLAGNVGEWVWDGRQSCYPTPDECDDCGVTLNFENKGNRGADFTSPARELRVEFPGGANAAQTRRYLGFRCARDF
jgi:formylglycine-generating enzyme